MLDPQAILGQARQGTAPAGWRVFTKARGRVRAADPDPLLVITPDGVAEYIDGKKSVATVDFGSLAGISLRVNGKTFSDSIQVRLDVWLDLHYRDGRKSKWRSASFADLYKTVQAFIEAYGAHQAFRSGGQYEDQHVNHCPPRGKWLARLIVSHDRSSPLALRYRSADPDHRRSKGPAPGRATATPRSIPGLPGAGAARPALMGPGLLLAAAVGAGPGAVLLITCALPGIKAAQTNSMTMRLEV